MRRSLALLVVAFATLIIALPTMANELVVVEARGIGLAPGATVDDTKPLVLEQGQHVVLISADGATLKIDGPYNKQPVASDDGDVLQSALRALVTQSGTRTTEAGVTRAGNSTATLPGPWLLDVSRTGDVCLMQGQQPVLWRPSVAHQTEMTIWPGDRSWKAEATWPAGADQLLVPPSLPVDAEATYLVSLDNGPSSAVTVHLVPGNLASDKVRIAWLAHQRCEAQAEALLRQTGGSARR